MFCCFSLQYERAPQRRGKRSTGWHLVFKGSVEGFLIGQCVLIIMYVTQVWNVIGGSTFKGSKKKSRSSTRPAGAGLQDRLHCGSAAPAPSEAPRPPLMEEMRCDWPIWRTRVKVSLKALMLSIWAFWHQGEARCSSRFSNFPLPPPSAGPLPPRPPLPTLWHSDLPTPSQGITHLPL